MADTNDKNVASNEVESVASAENAPTGSDVVKVGHLHVIPTSLLSVPEVLQASKLTLPPALEELQELSIQLENKRADIVQLTTTYKEQLAAMKRDADRLTNEIEGLQASGDLGLESTEVIAMFEPDIERTHSQLVGRASSLRGNNDEIKALFVQVHQVGQKYLYHHETPKLLRAYYDRKEREAARGNLGKVETTLTTIASDDFDADNLSDEMRAAILKLASKIGN